MIKALIINVFTFGFTALITRWIYKKGYMTGWMDGYNRRKRDEYKGD